MNLELSIASSDADEPAAAFSSTPSSSQQAHMSGLLSLTDFSNPDDAPSDYLSSDEEDEELMSSLYYGISLVHINHIIDLVIYPHIIASQISITNGKPRTPIEKVLSSYCCKRYQCLQNLTYKQVQNARAWFYRLDRPKQQYELKRMLNDSNTMIIKGKLGLFKLQHIKSKICIPAVRKILGVGNHRVARILSSLREGIDNLYVLFIFPLGRELAP